MKFYSELTNSIIGDLTSDVEEDIQNLLDSEDVFPFTNEELQSFGLFAPEDTDQTE